MAALLHRTVYLLADSAVVETDGECHVILNR
jgi:hypothetical protein